MIDHIILVKDYRFEWRVWWYLVNIEQKLNMMFIDVKGQYYQENFSESNKHFSQDDIYTKLN